MLRGIRVLDRTTGIAGPYCSKLLADAGADVIKEEPPTGDQLRNWRSGALFEYLNTSKRSIFNDRADLVRRADVLITEQPVDTEELWSTHPALVVVSITPFGCSGPWVDRASTEFTLQAACGSVGQRGLPDQPPLAAGGRIGEWATGAYAAVGTIAALKEARRCGQGEHVDVAMLDCMAVTMVTYPSVFASFSGVPPQSGTGRTIEVPSIEPTKDGFFVVTTNSAQQFQDFLVMIERADLLADTELPQSPVRFRRRDEFLSAVHGFTLRHTTAEMLEAASLYRIPAGPLLDGSSIPDFAQFKERGIFQESPSGRFLQPRVPYRISGTQSRPFEPAPEMGQHQANIHWHSPATSGKADGAVQQATDNVWRLPLHGIRVVDCTAWWAGPSATNVLTALGADVIKVESVTRPDNMRFASTRRPPADHWWEWGPIFHAVNVGKRDVTIDLSTPDGIAIFERSPRTQSQSRDGPHARIWP
jgi:crotonobetainyl-CoA:carnitine CoA-transferase CaiB-like acyl-CoA transferase